MINQQEYFGFNSIDNLKNILIKKRYKNILLITGKKSFEICGAKKLLEPILKNYNLSVFNDFSSNPKIQEIEKGRSQASNFNPDIIIAVGGGSSIDVAKAIKLLYYDDSNKNIPLIAIPTTAGSGSEATYFIVYYIGKEKQSKGEPNLTLPDYVILDPQFILNLPREIAASTAMDALAQAVESYWSIYSTEESKGFSRQSIQLLMKNLENSLSNNKEAKAEVMKAANLAGKAINIAKTTASHSIAYPITSYFGIPHGHAAALTLGEMLIYNFNITEKDCNDKRGVEYVKGTINELINMLDSKTPDEANRKIRKLIEKTGLKTKLSDLGLQKEDINIIIQKGFNPARVKNNPRLLTEENLRKILEDILNKNNLSDF